MPVTPVQWGRRIAETPAQHQVQRGTLCQRNMVEWYRTPNIPLWPLHMCTTTCVHTTDKYKHKPFFPNIRGTQRHFRMYFTSHMLRLKHICLVAYTTGYSFSLVFFPLFPSSLSLFETAVATAGLVH